MKGFGTRQEMGRAERVGTREAAGEEVDGALWGRAGVVGVVGSRNNRVESSLQTNQESSSSPVKRCRGRRGKLIKLTR